MDLAQLYAQQSAGWSAEIQHPGEEWFEQVVQRLLDFTDVGLGERVLNLGASGLSAVIAARRGAQVTALASTEAGRATIARAVNESGVERIDIHTGSATVLPFPSQSFDVILSVFSIQFEPEPGRVIQEISRVAKPGAMLGLALWDMDSPLGRFMALLGNYARPTLDILDGAEWGIADEVERRLADTFVELDFRFGNAPLYSASPEALWDRYRHLRSPMDDALDRLDAEQMARLTTAVIEQFREYTDFTGRVIWPREYRLVRGLRAF